MSIIVRIPGGVSMTVEARYNYLLGSFNEAELHAALAALSPPLPGFLGVGSAAGGVQVVCADVLAASDKTRLDAVVLAYAPAADYLTQRLRAVAQALLSDPQSAMKALRAVMGLVVDEVNILRARLRDQDAAVAAATTLADLKSRWAATAAASPMPARTDAQAKTAAISRIVSGSVD
jgi:hypothetical protein